ncbi:MAG: EscU/YscU/HrcU family type III secretion system export apparatus switch protein [Candidatus Lindowbacteria bacterium]|nr:EscU/YscU/HrcU family type III secretion system export apparatus switch protein [Candidatus Lindowbacteria bacterium]
MPEPYGGEKTEPATPRRREEVRKKGQVARSVDLTSSIVLLASMLALYFLTPVLMRELTGMTRSYLENAATVRVDAESAPALVIGMALRVSGFFVPFMLIIFSAALVSNMVQVGLNLSAYPLIPRIEKISPGAGFRRLFSARSFAECYRIPRARDSGLWVPAFSIRARH